MPMCDYCGSCDPTWWARGWECHVCSGSCIHVPHESFSAGWECHLCKQITFHWQEHRKRLRMGKYELQLYQSMTKKLRYELDLRNQRPVEVIARGTRGEDYWEGFTNIPWHGLKQISHVAEAIFRIAQCKNGAEIQVYKQTQLLSYDERLENLCDPHRQVELIIVVNHSDQQ